ncbi:hotdog fold thioesterase [Virgibacillus dokdonensis]|uniref:hotdog fold thioesterase n=1 Tax=Virgibacillus dokdonensis TaxID=302167 RepID=UPI00098A14E2|nr:hotdog fold thioesterase [Virgibacillus dokdonensis]
MAYPNTLMEALGIETVTMTKEKVQLTMPVDKRTRQPFGYLHGGASVALAESAASIGASLHADLQTQAVFGIEINANHIRSIKNGEVTATALPIHIGKSTMVWEIKITDAENWLLCVSRCTIGVITKEK